MATATKVSGTSCRRLSQGIYLGLKLRAANLAAMGVQNIWLIDELAGTAGVDEQGMAFADDNARRRPELAHLP